MRITVDEAREYFAHPSQHSFGMTERDLPEDCLYYAEKDTCLVFHPAYWPSVWMVHVGVRPKAWGSTDGQARSILEEFRDEHAPRSIVALIEAENRLAVALACRVGMKHVGAFSGLELMEWL